MTNLFGIAAEAGVSIRDLLSVNAGIKTGKPVQAGTTLVRPCYTQERPTYLGKPSDYLRFKCRVQHASICSFLLAFAAIGEGSKSGRAGFLLHLIFVSCGRLHHSECLASSDTLFWPLV